MTAGRALTFDRGIATVFRPLGFHCHKYFLFMHTLRTIKSDHAELPIHPVSLGFVRIAILDKHNPSR